MLVIGGASGIGREVALLLARKGAHITVADFDEAGAEKVAADAAAASSREQVTHARVNLASAQNLAEAVKFTLSQFGGIDGVVNTAAIYPVPSPDGELPESQWANTFLVNVTGNYLLAREADWIFKDQNLPSSMVLTSSANAAVPKKGSEAYDTSKAALNHLVRELAVKLGPQVRVNDIAPATVVAGSTMFPRDRVIFQRAKARRNSATSWQSSTRNARSRSGQSCRKTAQRRLCGCSAMRAPRPPGTSSRSMGGLQKRFCDDPKGTAS